VSVTPIWRTGSTFGNGGFFIFSFDELPETKKSVIPTPLGADGEAASGSALLPDGKIILVQGIAPPVAGLLVKLTAQGNFDTTSNGTGSVRVEDPDETADFTNIMSLIIDPIGNILMGGQVGVYEAGTDPYIEATLARFTPDGAPDVTFGHAGTGFIKPMPKAEYGGVNDIVLNTNGKIFGVGSHGVTQRDATAFGALANGQFDTDFNGGKINKIAPGSLNIWQCALSPPPYNFVVASGIAVDKENKNMGVLVGRFHHTGESDLTFGASGGWKHIEPGVGSQLAVQANGKILVAYRPGDVPGEPCVITRLLP
jgi:uncharacterized delta-60 repeat protein